MKKLILMSAICLALMYSCKNRAVTDVNQSPGAFVETVPDRDVIKQSDTAKLKTIDSLAKDKQ